MDSTFAIRYGVFRPLLTVLGLGPGVSGVTVAADEVRVRMGWGFRARFPRSAVREVARDRNRYAGIGVHGWWGRWLVNGAVSGIVTLRLEPPARAWVTGLPVRLRVLHVSLADPEAFLAGWRR